MMDLREAVRSVIGLTLYNLQNAAYNGRSDIVRLLLTYPSVDPTRAHNRYLRDAAANNHYKVVKLLLNDPRIKLTYDDVKYLKYVANNNGNDKMLRLLNNYEVNEI